MTKSREEVGGLLPAAAPSIRTIPAAASGLSRAVQARSEPFVASGERCTVTGVQSREEVRVSFDCGVTVELRPSVGTAANLLAYPGLIRREFVGPRGSASETVLCAPSLPLVAAQWTGSGRPDAVTVVPSAKQVGGEHGGTTSAPPIEVVERSDCSVVYRVGDDRYAAVLVSPDPAAIEFDADHPEGLRIRPGLMTEPAKVEVGVEAEVEAPATPVSVVLCAGSRDDVERALRAAPHLAGHAMRATAGPEREGLYVDSGVAEIDDGIAWARARLSLVLSGCGGDELLRCGVAALAAGDEDIARAVLERLAPNDARRGVLAGRMALTLGDTGPATSLAETVGSGAEGWRTDDPWYRAALDSLAAGLHNSAPEAVAALRAMRAEAPVARGEGGGRRLPMVGGSAPPPNEADRLLRLLGGFEGLAPAPRVAAEGVPGPADLLAETAPLFRTDPDRAWPSWREVIGAGLDQGPMGPGSWDAQDGHGAITADLLLAFVHGLLGLGPDAPSGRLRIAPRLPAHLTSFAAGGLRIGAARLRLNVERSPGVDRYEFVPEFAGVPPLLIFEPAVSGTVQSVRIDGATAELDTRHDRGRTVVPVQLPLDGVRTVEIWWSGSPVASG